MPDSTRDHSCSFRQESGTTIPGTGFESALPAWIGFVARAAATCLFVAAFMGAIDRLHRPIAWTSALSNIPLRPEARICGMVGDMPLVGMPGMPLRLFGAEVRQRGRNWTSDWFGDSIGDLLHGEPVMVQVPYSEFGDEEMPLIAQAPTLRSLALDGTRITDAGLRNLLLLTSLEILSVGDTNITDTGVETLSRLTSLRDLDLRGTRLTGAAIESLARLPRLETLNLSRTTLEFAGLRLPTQLRTLLLNDVSLNDDDLAAFGTLKCLRRLQLKGTRVTVAGVARLAALGQLESCEIDGAIFSRSDLDSLRVAGRTARFETTPAGLSGG